MFINVYICISTGREFEKDIKELDLMKADEYLGTEESYDSSIRMRKET
jgi:hypothetical protein